MAEENGQSRYVVQRRTTDGDWEDIRALVVPPRTKRKTILEKALVNSSEMPGAGHYRILDEESAKPIEVSLEEQPPRLKIG